MASIFLTAKKEFEKIERHRKSRRFKRVISFLIQAKVFQKRLDIEKYKEKPSIKDYIWAGKYETRIYEVLPALVLKKPSIFNDLENAPEDLKQTVRQIRKGKDYVIFRKVEPKAYLKWIPIVGHKGREASLLKSFRFQQNDLKILHILKTHGYSETEAIREGLKALMKNLQNSHKT